jgi:hypothetical protein
VICGHGALRPAGDISGSTIAAWLATGSVQASTPRVNAAADLVEAGVPIAEAARVLAARFGCSVRQARRYAEQAIRAGQAEVPQDTVVFTVKLRAGLVARVRAHARWAGLTISAVVAQTLEEFLARGHRDHPAGESPAGRGGVRLRPARGHRFVGGLRHIGPAAAGPHRPVRPGRTTT